MAALPNLAQRGVFRALTSKAVIQPCFGFRMAGASQPTYR